MSTEPSIIRSAVCTRCGCACDDVDLKVSENRVVEALNVCELGRPWFLTPRVEEDPPALVHGKPAGVEEGAAAAAELLAGARRPIVWGLIHLPSEAQRLAVEIAERVRGVIDPAAGPNHAAAITAFAEWGEVDTTFGEVAVQSGMVVLWLAEPERSHPRLLERWRIGEGKGDRLIRFRRGALSPGSWSVPEGRELEFLWMLRELARERAARGADAAGGIEAGGIPTGETGAAGTNAQARSGLRALARRLLDRIAGARYTAFAFDAAATDPGQQHALRAVAATLNAVARFRLVPLREAGNRIGAEAVLAWQTGFPVAVDFGAGVPRANGGEFSAARLLARGDVDAALVVCASPADFVSEPALARLAEIPVAVLDSEPNPLAPGARVSLRSAPYGLASPGTFFRMDGVALGLRPALESRYPSEQEWLTRILACLSGPDAAAREAGA